MCLIQKENYKKSHKNQFFRPGNGVLVWQVIPGYDSLTGGRVSFLYLARGLVLHLRTLPPIMQWAAEFWRKVAVKATLSAVVTSMASASRGILDPLRVSMVTEATKSTTVTSYSVRDETCWFAFSSQGAAEVWKVDLAMTCQSCYEVCRTHW